MALPFDAANIDTPLPAPAGIGVVLAIDYGRKRLGLALSDSQGLTARPFATWQRINRRRDLSRLRDLVRQHGIGRIVVGLPLHLDGTSSEMSEEAKAFATRVARALGITVVMFDERLSSWEAGKVLATTGRSKPASRVRAGTLREKRKTPLDELAAAIILRDYLNRERQEGSRD